MGDVGFLYVLANSSMQGLVKVGKTRRSPAERAAELSAATGLPTPFIVVYEQLFEDCTRAEDFVHTLLGGMGFRLSDNREFFSAPVNDVVRAIARAPGAIEGTTDDTRSHQDDGLLTRSIAGDELDDLTLAPNSLGAPWLKVFEEAESHYYGLDDVIQDYAEAMRLYKQAAKLGCLPAYVQLGVMYENGEGVRVNKQSALEFYREGARRGSLLAYWKMGALFRYSDPPNYVNAFKCYKIFIREYQQRNCASEGYVTSSELDQVTFDCAMMIRESQFRNRYDLPQEILDFCQTISERIAEKVESFLSRARQEGRIDETNSFVIDDLERVPGFLRNQQVMLRE